MQILFVCHGSRLKVNNEQYRDICNQVGLSFPQHKVIGSYLNFSTPSFDNSLNECLSFDSHILIVPLFFFNAKHAKQDIPNIIKKYQNKYANSTIRSLDISQCFTHSMLNEIQPLVQNKSFLIIIGRGSSDTQSIQSFKKYINNVSSSIKANTLAAYCDLAQPSLNNCLSQAVKQKFSHIIIFPYFLFNGKLLEDINTDISIFKKSYPKVIINLCKPFGYHKHFTESITTELKKLETF